MVLGLATPAVEVLIQRAGAGVSAPRCTLVLLPGMDGIYIFDPNGIRLEASTAPAQGDNQQIMANRSQTKARVRAEIETLCDDPEWVERAIACFKD